MNDKSIKDEDELHRAAQQIARQCADYLDRAFLGIFTDPLGWPATTTAPEAGPGLDLAEMVAVIGWLKDDNIYYLLDEYMFDTEAGEPAIVSLEMPMTHHGGRKKRVAIMKPSTFPEFVRLCVRDVPGCSFVDARALMGEFPLDTSPHLW